MPRLVVLLVVLLTTLPGPARAQAVSCASFDAIEWAQSVVDANPAGNAALDPDGDGLACEELPNGAAPALWTDEVPAGAEPATLNRVVDGDTAEFLLPDGIVADVRFILIDTPEVVDPNQPVACYGAEASAFTAWLLSLGGQVYLETDVTEQDRFGRLLRYVWLDFGGREVYLVNEAIARSGYGQVSTYPPDVKYLEQLREATRFAREHQFGLWGACGEFGVPVEPAPAQQPAAPQPAPEPVQPNPQPAPAPSNCDPSYPTLCLQSSPDLDCGEITARRFPVVPPDPHGFDGDFDGVGCEAG